MDVQQRVILEREKATEKRTSSTRIFGVYFIYGFCVHCRGMLPRIYAELRQRNPNLHEGRHDSGLCSHDLLRLHEVRNVALGVDASRVEATSVAVDAATGDQSEREGSALERQSGDDLHETENGDGNQVAREEVLEGGESTDDRVVEHEHGIHGGREEAVLVGEGLALRIYVKANA